MKKIYFSPSDQTRNTYATGNTNEAAECRQIALYAVEAAKRCGFEALTDAVSGGDSAMDKRITQSNNWGADIHIPIHTNAFNGSVQGTRIFCYNLTGDGHRLSKAIMDTLSPITPGSSDNITTARFAEILEAKATVSYVEVGFHDNKEEAQWIIDNKREIAEAIVKGLCNYFGVQYVDSAVEPEKESEKEPEVVAPSKTELQKKMLYRVRKAANDAKSQIGAFYNLNSAKSMADKNDGYKVFDANGVLIYEPKEEISNAPATPNVPTESQKEAWKTGDIVRLTEDAKIWDKDRKFSSWVYKTNLYIRALYPNAQEPNRAVISIYKTGDITGVVGINQIKRI